MRGYPVLWVRLAAGGRRLVKVHRLVAELVNGEVDETVDHTCHDPATCPGGENDPHRRCLNPAHLAPESRAGNAARNRAGMRQEVCGKGHPMNVTASGRRYCCICAADAARARRAAKGEQRAPRSRRREGAREYRPRGMTRVELVNWGLEGQLGPGCWYWRGNPGASADGYRNISIGKTTIDVHRLVYETINGPIPDRLVVDHICHDPQLCTDGPCPHRACCRPDHLVAVTNGQNTAAHRRRKRPDVCKYGHDLTDAYVDKRGTRHCRQCANDRQNAARQAAREGQEDQRFRVDGRCRNNHRIADVGETPEGKCAQCARDAKLRYKQRQRATQAAAGF